MLALYPDNDIQSQIPEEKWTDMESDWVTVLDAYLSGTAMDDVSPFVESFLAHYNEATKSVPHLRKRVFTILLDPSSKANNLFRQPTPEFIWNLVRVYGSQNVTKVCEFITTRKNLSLLLKKLQKLVLFHAKTQPKAAEEFLTVIFSSQILAKQFSEDKWWIQNVKNYPELDILTNRGHAVEKLREMFPDISLIRCSQLLDQYISVEDATAYLLEHPDQVSDQVSEQAPKEKDASAEGERPTPKKIVYEAPQLVPSKQLSTSSSSSNQKDPKADELAAITQRLIAMQMDEEEELENEEQEQAASKKSKLALPSEEEPNVYKAYKEVHLNPNMFLREQRNSVERSIFKSKVTWTHEQIEGWYKMLQRNPARMEQLEHKYMCISFGEENDDHFLNWVPQTGKEDTTSSSNNNPQNSKGKKPAKSNSNTKAPNAPKAQHTPHSQKKNHHRKDKHTKKLATAS